jgi:RIO kinase 1
VPPPSVSRAEELLFPRRKERTEERRKERSHHDVRDEVFDRLTLLAVSRLVTQGQFQEVDYSISTGKEANVFRVSGRSGFGALKIYRISNAVFRRFPPWALEDLRRTVGPGSFGRLVFAWAHREFTAMKACELAAVPVPRPRIQWRNLLLMDLVGSPQGVPAPPLVHTPLPDPRPFLEELVAAVRRMTEKARLVHGDLSPYNVLVNEGHPVLIDLGQTISVDHPQAPELLKRDALNFARFFRRAGLPVEGDDLFRRMGGDRWP